MSFWQSENIRHTIGGTWTARPASDSTAIGISTDTRALKPGQLFLALKGDTFDGNTMLAAAARAGATIAIIDDADKAGQPPAGLGVMRVPDARRALLRLAAAYRKTLERTRVIAVGGSNGKTTTVRLITAVLSQAMRGTASQKSFNNDVGVPLTILSASPGDQFLICEVGTNAPGEIATLAAAVQPDIGVITSIGREHLERLGSLRGVAREEAHLLEFIRPGGMGFIPAGSDDLREIIGSLPSKPPLLSFGFEESADVRVMSVEQSLAGLSFTLNTRASFRMPILGRHNAANAAAAIAVARRLGLSDLAIASGLEAVKGESMRLEVSRIGELTIVNDAYNANPDSMRASLETFDEVAHQARRRIVILGDMLELGEHTDASHREIVEAALAHHSNSVIVLVGPNMKAAARKDSRITLVDDLNPEAASRIEAMLQPGDCILLKGSRRMKLERLLTALRHGQGAPT